MEQIAAAQQMIAHAFFNLITFSFSYVFDIRPVINMTVFRGIQKGTARKREFP